MTVFRRIRDIDVMQTVLTPSNRVTIVSGSSGWRGGDVSGSVSLYAGTRSPPGTRVVRSTSGSFPMSSSISYVEVKLADITETRTRWGNRTWRVVEGLYSFYSRYNTSYSTQSYDFQCVFFKGQSENIIVSSDSFDFLWSQVTGAITVEAWVKPFTTASHLHGGHTIASRTGLYWLGLTGSDCRLMFSSSLGGIHTSSVTLDLGRWSHVAVTAGSGTGSLYVNLLHGDTFTYSALSMSITTASFHPAFCVGNIAVTSSNQFGTVYETTNPGSNARSFHGMIHDVREWKRKRSWTEISSSHNRRLSINETTDVVNYLPMTAGHRSGSSIAGSSSVNFSSTYPTVDHTLVSFEGNPSWMPNGNSRFFAPKDVMRESSDYARATLRAINIPKIYYGDEIATGSFELTCRSFSANTLEMIRHVKDDGRGGLYVKSFLSSSIDDDSEEFVSWNRIGNIFYSEGIVVITDDSSLDLGQDSAGLSAQPNSRLSISFNGKSHVPVKMISCRLAGGEANASLNPTFFTESDEGRRTTENKETYITSVVLYDSERRPVAVVKLATPMRKRDGDRLNIKVRKDF